MSERPLVFISCGQYHDSEKTLGKEIAQLANEMGLEGYFAENQNSVAALASNIFAKLNEAAALVVVIHPRGTVQGLGGESHIRASLWIEQEIAIASFLQTVSGHRLEVQAFIHKHLNGMREGVREQVQLNPTVFEDEAEVLKRLREVFPTWQTLRNNHERVELTPHIQFQNVRDIEKIREVMVRIVIENTGTETVHDFRVDVDTPLGSRRPGVQYAHETHSENGRFCQQVTHDLHRISNFYPGDKNPVLVYQILIDTNVLDVQPGNYEGALITVTVNSSGMKAQTATRPLSDVSLSWMGSAWY